MSNVGGRSSLTTRCILLFICVSLVIIFFLPFPKSNFSWTNDDLSHSFDPSSQSVNDDLSGSESPPLLLLISYDAFRYDYIEKYHNVTPTLRWLIANWVYAKEGLKNTFITITAPNHYGIVTGLYEENHGIIANSFFDPDLNETFSYFDTRSKTNPKFFRGDPIWNTNDAAGSDRLTGCVMWVGCDVPINNRPPPQRHVSWEQSVDWTTRVDLLIKWFTDPSKPINFGLLYIEEPDETGHSYGPDSPEMRDTLRLLDQLTAYLLWRLYTAKLLDKINIIFTADHGMSAVPVLNVVNMDKYLNNSLYTVYGGSPNWNVKPVEGKEEEIYNRLHNKVPHLTVYKKSNIPAEFHYQNTSGVMPLQLIPDLHWWITYNYTDSMAENTSFPLLVEQEVNSKRMLIRVTSRNFTTGSHGYNNSIMEMHPYFIGYGPAFKKSYNVTQFMNLNLYVMMCYILHLKPSPNNGSFDRVRFLLQDEGARWAKPVSVYRCNSLAVCAVRDMLKSIHETFGSVYEWYTTDLILMLLILVLYVTYLSYAVMSTKRPSPPFGKVAYVTLKQ